MTATLDPISLLLVYSAIIVYVAAFVSYVADLASQTTKPTRHLVTVGGPLTADKSAKAARKQPSGPVEHPELATPSPHWPGSCTSPQS